jgi:hypothetical protein
MGTRFAKRPVIQLGHLIGTDDEGVRKARRKCSSFFPGQPKCCISRRLGVSRRFIDLRRGSLERDPEAGEELSTVWGTGGQNQLLHDDATHSSLTKLCKNNTLARLCPTIP